MSLASIKAKETKTKTKVKNPKKLKTFLASPYKPKIPALDVDDFCQLRKILATRIEQSGQSARAFATTNHICLGLESSLRAINNCKAACVLLSHTIKPRYLLGLVARNVEVKDKTVPTYVQTDLEDFTLTVFGVRALAVVLPKDAATFDEDLGKWLTAHKIKKKERNVKQLPWPKKSTKSNQAISSNQTPSEQLKCLSVTNDSTSALIQETAWGSDYISFNKSYNNAMEVDTEHDEEKLIGVLSEMSKKVKQTSLPAETATMNDVEMERPSTSRVEQSNSDDDDYLGSYQPLTVHKIQANPNRKPKKKRKKNTNVNKK